MAKDTGTAPAPRPAARVRNVALVEHAGHRITLLDTPGSPDFVGELRAGLRAADAALFVVSAVNGVDAATVQLWEECAAVGLCQLLLGEGVYPVHLVDRGPDGSIRGLVSLLEPDASAPEADRLRSELIEGIIGESEDEALMERDLAGDQLVQADLIADLETAVARGHFHPVLCAAPLQGVGLDSLLYLLVNGFPCPMEHGCPPVARPDGSPAPPLSCDPD